MTRNTERLNPGVLLGNWQRLAKMFADGELDATLAISKMETTTPHGAMTGKTQIKVPRFYNVDAIKGRLSKQQASDNAEKEYGAFNKTQKVVSDFDKAVKRLENNGGSS